MAQPLDVCPNGRVALKQRTAPVSTVPLEVSNEASGDWVIIGSSQLPTCGLRSILRSPPTRGHPSSGTIRHGLFSYLLLESGSEDV